MSANEDVDDPMSCVFTVVCTNGLPKMASKSFVKLSEADVKSFSDEQENANKNKKTAYFGNI